MVNGVKHHWIYTFIILPVLLNVSITLAQTTAFTYQGKLVDNGTPASGTYDLNFKLFDTATVGSGAQQGATLNLTSVPVSAGVFTVQLDFGACASCFNGSARFLEISVKPSSGSTFTTLSPRQQLTATPYALKSLSATTADGLSVTCVSCVTSSQIQSVNGSVVSGTIPVTSVPAGSDNYIHNTASQQATSNFNISGNGTAGGTLSGNIVNASTQYNLNGVRVFTVNGALSGFTATNTFAGDGAGVNTTPNPTSQFGNFNSFYGAGAGQANTTGFNNAFYGYQAGFSNPDGFHNSFFGSQAGFSNTTGFSNSFFGKEAGRSNTIGINNAFFGYITGYANTGGDSNSFFGQRAGRFNSTGDSNAFVGSQAGYNNTIGSQNTFIGTDADFNTSNPTGNNNSLLGYSTNVNSGVSNGTAIGAFASVTQSNSLVLGGINGVNGATANTNVGIGITAPQFRLHVEEPGNLGLRVGTSSLGGKVASFGPFGNFEIDAPNIPGGRFFIAENGSVNIGNGKFVVTEFGNVGINRAAPAATLDVNGNIRFNSLGAAGGTSLCLNSSSFISFCSSSRRYKNNIADWHSGLSLLNRLRPVTFDWKESKMHDIGLVAEEVAEVEPLLVTHNDKGEIEGVKYDRLGVVLLNAIKEQQSQIETLQKDNLEMKERLASLERLMQQQPFQQIKKVN